MAALAHHLLQVCTWAVLIFLLVLSCLLGSVSSVGAVLFSLPFLALLFYRTAWTDLLGQPAMIMFLGVFTLLTAVFALTARQPGNVLYFANFLALLAAAPVYLVARRWSGSGPILTVAALCVVGVSLGSLFSINEVFIKQLPRAFGWAAGGNLMPRIALTLGFIALSGVFVAPSRYRLLFLLGLEFAFIATFLSGSRGAALALPAMALVFAVFVVVGRPVPRPWRLLLALVLVLTLTYVALALLTAGGARFEGLGGLAHELYATQSSGSDAAAGHRMTMAAAALKAFVAAPWFGYGWANMAFAASPHMDMSVWGGPEDPFFQYHNDLANFAVAAGTIGILCWLALLAAPLVGALATPRDRWFRLRLYCCMQLCVGYLIFGLTDMTLGYDLTTTLYAFLTAMVLGTFRDAPA